jgi:hypothetical protein
MSRVEIATTITDFLGQATYAVDNNDLADALHYTNLISKDYNLRPGESHGLILSFPELGYGFIGSADKIAAVWAIFIASGVETTMVLEPTPHMGK